MEQHSDSHKYHPHSSYFPLDHQYSTTSLSSISLPTLKILLTIHGSTMAPTEPLSMTLLLIFRHASMLGALMPENLLNQNGMEKNKWRWLLVLPELGSAWLSHASWAKNSQAELFPPLGCLQWLDPTCEPAHWWYSRLSHSLPLLLEVTIQTKL